MFLFSIKSPAWILIEVTLNLQMNLRKIDTFRILSILLNEDDIFFHLFKSSLISHNNLCSFQYLGLVPEYIMLNLSLNNSCF